VGRSISHTTSNAVPVVTQRAYAGVSTGTDYGYESGMALNKKQKERLPATLQRSPAKAQDTYIHTLESAEKDHGDGEAAHRIALSSLKHSFEKVGDHWEAKAEKGPSDAQAARPSGRAKISKPRATAGGVDANASKKHLLEVARRLDVEGRSKMDKAELVDAIDTANRRETEKARRADAR
jgi:cation transport regulator ChaB